MKSAFKESGLASFADLEAKKVMEISYNHVVQKARVHRPDEAKSQVHTGMILLAEGICR